MQHFEVERVLRTLHLVAFRDSRDDRVEDRQAEHHCQLQSAKGEQMDGYSDESEQKVEHLIAGLVGMLGLGRDGEDADEGHVEVGREGRHHQDNQTAVDSEVGVDEDETEEHG